MADGMTQVATRRLLHTAHGVTTLILLFTGCLIQWPDLRAQIVGGYGRELAQIHLWSSAVYAVAPLLAIGVAGGSLFANLRQRFVPADRVTWQNLHITITLVTSVLLIVSGIVLWRFHALPLMLQDVSLEIHIWATWIVAASLPLHLVVARRKIVERVRRVSGQAPPPLFEFLDEDPDPEDP